MGVTGDNRLNDPSINYSNFKQEVTKASKEGSRVYYTACGFKSMSKDEAKTARKTGECTMVKFQVLHVIAKDLTPEGTNERKGLNRCLTKMQYPLTGELGKFLSSIFKKEKNESLSIAEFVGACKNINKKLTENKGETEFVTINKRAKAELGKAQEFFHALPKDPEKWSESQSNGFRRQLNICKDWTDTGNKEISLNLNSEVRKEFLKLQAQVQTTFNR